MKQYEANTITNAIIRLDFASPIHPINAELAASVRSTCLKYFEIPDQSEIQSQEFQLSNEPGVQSMTMNHSTMTEWCFKGKNSRKELKISQNYLLIEVQDYSTFEDFKNDFIQVFSAFKNEYGEVQISRMGMRYINQIKLGINKAQSESWHNYWSQYLDVNLLGALAFTDDDSSLAQQMNSCVMNYGDFSLNFQYGMFNPDYPAVAKKPVFVLDTDVYSAGLLGYEDIVAGLDSFHNRVSEWFEKSITDELRRILGDCIE